MPRYMGIFLLIMTLFVPRAYARTLVLLYHAFSPSPRVVTEINPEYFRNHIKELKSEGFEIISLGDALKNFLEGDTSHAPKALITIDDGWASVKKYAFPIIQEEKVPVVLFVYPRAISRYEGFLSWGDINEMISSGLVDVGSHGMSHTPLRRDFIWRKLYFAWFAEGELAGSKEIIEFHTGEFVYAVAYPFGYYSPDVIEIAKSTNYKLGFTTEDPLRTPYQNRFTIPRYVIMRKDRSILQVLRIFKSKYHLAVKPKGTGSEADQNSHFNSSPFFVQLSTPITEKEKTFIADLKPSGVILTFTDGENHSYEDSLRVIAELGSALPVETGLYIKVQGDRISDRWDKSRLERELAEWNRYGVKGVVVEFRYIRGNGDSNYLLFKNAGIQILLEINDADELSLLESDDAEGFCDGLILPELGDEAVSKIEGKPLENIKMVIVKSDKFVPPPPWALFSLVPEEKLEFANWE